MPDKSEIEADGDWEIEAVSRNNHGQRLTIDETKAWFNKRLRDTLGPGKKTQRQLARELGVAQSSLNDWIHEPDRLIGTDQHSNPKRSPKNDPVEPDTLEKARRYDEEQKDLALIGEKPRVNIAEESGILLSSATLRQHGRGSRPVQSVVGPQ